jgi:DNA-binding FadR family transcriptional regulator
LPLPAKIAGNYLDSATYRSVELGAIMSVSSVSLSQGATPTVSNGRSSIRQERQDFDQLYQALQSGNLSAAQQAYGDFQKVQASLASASTETSGTTTASTTKAVKTDWTALGQALQTGSLTGAQDALGKLLQDAQAALQSRHQLEAQNAQSVYALMHGVQGASGTSTATATNASASTGSVQNDLNALSQALRSGDTASAQKLLAQLEQDLQASGQSNGGHHHHHHHHGGFSRVDASSAYTAASATGTGSTSAASSSTSTSAA